MICYVFKVRRASYMSKKDNKEKKGFNVGLVCLEGSKFHLETFIDDKDHVFAGELGKTFKPGFWNIDIDEFEIYTPTGSQYSKKIISITSKSNLEAAKCFLDI